MNKPTWRMVERYVAGEATPEERAVMEHWLAESEMLRTFVADLRADEALVKLTANARKLEPRDDGPPRWLVAALRDGFVAVLVVFLLMVLYHVWKGVFQ